MDFVLFIIVKQCNLNCPVIVCVSVVIATTATTALCLKKRPTFELL